MPLGCSSGFPLKYLDCCSGSPGVRGEGKLGDSQVNVFVPLPSVRVMEGEEVAPCFVDERTVN